MEPTPEPNDSEILAVKSNLPQQLAGTSFDTSERELIISLATLLTLMQLPGPLVDLQFRIIVTQTNPWFMYLSLFYMTIAIYALIIFFLAHLAARGFWVGLLGLRSVFPNPVDWEKQNTGPMMTRYVQNTWPTLERLIMSSDRLGSLIFSAATAVVILMVYITILISLAGVIDLGLRQFLPWKARAGIAFLGFVMLIMLHLLDHYYKKNPDKYDPDLLPNKLAYRIIGIFAEVSLSRLYGPITATFSSHGHPKKIATVLLFSIIGGTALFVQNILSERFGSLIKSRYPIFPTQVEKQIDPAHYETGKPPERMYEITIPTLESDVVKGPYIKLFLPLTSKSQRAFEGYCSDLEPLKGKKDAELDEAIAKSLECIRRYYRLTLNGEPLHEPMDFYTHPIKDIKGLLMYIPTRELEEGKHKIHVIRGFEDQDEEDIKDFYIPFWK